MRQILALCFFVLSLFTLLSCGSSDSDDSLSSQVPEIVVLSNVQAADPVEFEMTRLLVDLMKQVGFNARHRAMPWEQQADLVWYSRDKWQMTAWRMVGRPERVDPDEFVVNLFHSELAELGYNIVGYQDADYDSLAIAQRALLNREERRQTIFAAQAKIAEDLPYLFVAHPKRPVAFRADLFDPKSVVEMAGIGIQNFWTWLRVQPTRDEKSIIANTDNVIQAINPLYISGEADSRVTELIWDRLLRVSSEGLPEPWVATHVNWVNDQRVRVSIRDDVKWHDGRPLTVDDVCFSYFAAGSGEAPMYKPFVDKIDTIMVVDDSTLEFHLTEPWVAFEVAGLAKVNLIPAHIWQPILDRLHQEPDNAESFQEEMPIGSGPYKFTAWKRSEEVILAANEDHFAAPKAERWILRITPNVEAALGQLRTGELNFLTEWEGDASLLASAAEDDPKISMVASTDLGFRFFAVNMRHSPLNRREIRQALAHIVPRQATVRNIFKGYAEPADSYISPAIKYWHNPELKSFEFGVEKARERLKDAGYSWDAQGKIHFPIDPAQVVTPAPQPF